MKFSSIAVCMVATLAVANIDAGAGFIAVPKTGIVMKSRTFLTNHAKFSPLLSMASQEGNEKGAAAVPNHLVSARVARIMTPASAFLAAAFAPQVALAADGAVSQAPAVGNFNDSLQKYFPGSFENNLVGKRVNEVLLERGYKTQNTLMGTSLCSDEINGTPGSLQATLQKSLVDPDKGVFNLGGLGGLPFSGKTGMGAFLSHCPDSGKVIILFGPHVGISQQGVVGKVERLGQSKPSTSCGAAVGAYKAIVAEKAGKSHEYTDFQEEFIIDTLRDRLDGLDWKNLDGDDKTIAFVTKQMYKLASECLLNEISSAASNNGFWDKVSEVTLLGGIVINKGHGPGLPGGDDYFQPLLMKSVTAKGETNLFDKTFSEAAIKKQMAAATGAAKAKAPAPAPAPIKKVAPPPPPPPVVVAPPPPSTAIAKVAETAAISAVTAASAPEVSETPLGNDDGAVVPIAIVTSVVGLIAGMMGFSGESDTPSTPTSPAPPAPAPATPPPAAKKATPPPAAEPATPPPAAPKPSPPPAAATPKPPAPAPPSPSDQSPAPSPPSPPVQSPAPETSSSYMDALGVGNDTNDAPGSGDGAAKPASYGIGGGAKPKAGAPKTGSYLDAL